jgi:hypothetical protein
LLDHIPPELDDYTVARLPVKYRKYIGEHEAHPGEGKGRMALLRAEERAAAEAAE